MFTHAARITEMLGAWNQTNAGDLNPMLRRGNRIRTIQASLAIEQNTLTIEQVSDVLEGKPVFGHPREILEVKNAQKAYDAMPGFTPHSLDDLLKAHGLLMAGLIEDAGRLRHKGVGVFDGGKLVHMAPPARQLPRLMENLLGWLETTDAHPLIASCAFHYEFEFIHPFSDGNGRMGRLWQTLILSRWQPMMAYLPIETVIKRQQPDYYRLLAEADESTDCSKFILFLLDAIEESLTGQVAGQVTGQVDPWVNAILSACLTGPKSARELQAIIGIKHRETFQRNYLDKLLAEGLLERTVPDKPNSRLQKYRLTAKGRALL